MWLLDTAFMFPRSLRDCCNKTKPKPEQSVLERITKKSGWFLSRAYTSICLSVCLSVLFTTPIWIAYGWMHGFHTHESIGLRGCGCVVRVCVWFCLFVIIFTQFNCTRKTPTISAFCGIQVTSIQAVVNSALKIHQESNNIDFVKESERESTNY